MSDVWRLNSGEPAPPLVEFTALWDTGATKTCVTKSVVDDCGLTQIGFTKIRHAQGVADNVPVYLANITLPNGVQIEGIPVAQVDLGEGVDVLVGMDIISMGDFAVTSPGGKTKFSFRFPSLADIDFVKEIGAENARRDVMSRQTRPKEATRQRARRNRGGRNRGNGRRNR